MKEWLLLAATVGVTLLLGLGVIRWLAPMLLRSPSEVRIVQVDERVVPFYEGIFRREDREAKGPMLGDPTLIKRARPFQPDRRFMGPTDAFGFRNRSIPIHPRVITIGDSQTYGMGVPIDSAWPHLLSISLGDPTSVYDMSTGGWGAAQYLHMWEAAAFFDPEVVVIAFYAGNDPREAFRAAYSIERFAFLRPDLSLDADDLPPVKYPSPRSELWAVRFGGSTTMLFTPTLRLGSNLDHPAVAAGWEIMARVAERILEDAKSGGPQPVFTLIPTKERVFEERMRAGGVQRHRSYDALVAGEATYSRALAKRIWGAGGQVVNVAGGLSRAALDSLALYPHTTDGHMAPPGHAIVAERIHEHIAPLLR